MWITWQLRKFGLTKWKQIDAGQDEETEDKFSEIRDLCGDINHTLIIITIEEDIIIIIMAIQAEDIIQEDVDMEDVVLDEVITGDEVPIKADEIPGAVEDRTTAGEPHKIIMQVDKIIMEIQIKIFMYNVEDEEDEIPAEHKCRTSARRIIRKIGTKKIKQAAGLRMSIMTVDMIITIFKIFLTTLTMQNIMNKVTEIMDITENKKIIIKIDTTTMDTEKDGIERNDKRR